MSPKGRRNHRRYNGRRLNDRKRSVLWISLILLFVIAVTVGTVFLGKYLKGKARISEENRVPPVSDTLNVSTDISIETSILSQAKVPVRLLSRYVSASSIGSGRLDLPEGNAFSVVMRNYTGELKYFSPVARTLGIENISDELPSCGDIVSELSNGSETAYVSAFAWHSGHDGESSAVTNAFHAFDSALIDELSGSGVSEIILCGFEMIDAEKAMAVCEFSAECRRNGENKVPLGILLPYDFFLSEDGRRISAELSKYFEIIAVDLTDIEATEEQTSAQITAETVNTMQMYFSRYSVRAVINSDSEDAEDIINALESRAIYGINAVSKNDLKPVKTEGDEKS